MASSYTIPSESWCRKTSLILIRCYKSYPHLYNKDHPDYLKKDKRAEAYEQITQTLQTIKPSITVVDVRKRIKTLLGQLNKAKKNHFKGGNNGTKANVKPKLWCYKELEFLLKLNKDKAKNTAEDGLVTQTLPSFSQGIRRELNTENVSENLEARIKPTNAFEHTSTKVNERKKQRRSSLEEAVGEVLVTSNLPSFSQGIKRETEDASENLEARIKPTNASEDTSTKVNEKKKRRSSLEEAALAALQVAESAAQDVKTYRQQIMPVEAFCQYLCTEMQQLRLETFNKLKIDMMELLNEALIKDQQHKQHDTSWHRVINEAPTDSRNSSSIATICHDISGTSTPFKRINLQKIKIFQPPSEEATYTQL